MTEPMFVRADDVLVLDGSGGTVLFLPADGDFPAPSLALSQTDAIAGTYFFQVDCVGQGLGAAVRGWRATQPTDAGPRMVWIANPSEPWERWQTLVLACSGDGPGRRITRPLRFAAGDIGVSIHPEAQISLDPDRPMLRLHRDAGPVATLDRATASIACTDVAFDFGAPGGVWRFECEVPAGQDGFALLGAGLRYVIAGRDGAAPYVLQAAMLRQRPDAALRLRGSLDPLRLLDRGRTHLLIESAGPFDTGLLATNGGAVTLAPTSQAERSARLSFHRSDLGDGVGLYLSPEGMFDLRVDGRSRDTVRLLCGVSALETLEIPAGGAVLDFVAGRPAFAGGPGAVAALDLSATTAWVSLAAGYHAQAEAAPLFGVTPGTDGTAGFLSFLDLAIGRMPPPDGVRGFPLLPFGGLAHDATGPALHLERSSIAPARRDAIRPLLAGSAALFADTEGGEERIGVTPQGLAVGLSAGDQWNWLGIGHAGPGEAAAPDLRITRVGPALRAAMQANDLFMVLGDPAVFQADSSVGYRLTDADLRHLAASGPAARWPEDRLEAVRRTFGQAGWPMFADRAAFLDALAPIAPALDAAQVAALARIAARCTIRIGDWSFRLSPESWTDADTVVLLKFARGRSIAALAADPAAWAWRAAASPRGADTASADIVSRIAAARAQAATEAAQGIEGSFTRFIRIVDDPDWVGVLALSVEVPLDALPESLGILAGGINRATFRAHHVGIAATPYRIAVDGFRFAPSAVFAAIEYRNPVDQYFASDIDFAFRVNTLTVAVDNSAVTEIACTAQLMVNRLFGARTRLVPTDCGNNIVLRGSYQEQHRSDGGRHGQFVFANEDSYMFLLPDGGVLRSVEFRSVELLSARPAAGSTEVQAMFQIGGALRFAEPDGPFDPFGWGNTIDDDVATPGESSLRFANLMLSMAFAPDDPAASARFTLHDGDLRFDLAASPARPESLPRRFPARLVRMIAEPRAASAEDVEAPLGPDTLGFIAIDAPIRQAKLTRPWYGLVYRLDLGSLGPLAGNAPLGIEILVAWSASGEDRLPLYLGVKLPGADARVGISLPLQGLLKLGFKSIAFLVDAKPGKARVYSLRLRDFGIQMLGLSFPPGRNDIYLFADPAGGSDARIGWYAAYAKAGGDTTQTALPARLQAALSPAVLDQEGPSDG